MLVAFVFVMGAIVGSFLNVCILRIPKEESIVRPPSHCVSCQKSIQWYDNIPIISFLFLKGRCRECQKPIAWQYIIIETATALLFLLFYLCFGFSAVGFIYLTLTLLLLVESVIDMRYQIIPDSITLPGILLGLCLSGLFPGLHGGSRFWEGFLQSLLGIVAGGGFLYLIGSLFEKILKKEAMGGGDVKLLAMIGAFLGWKGVLWTAFAASFSGAFVGLYYKFKTGEERIPFGPHLALGAFLFIFIGNQFIHWYLETMAL